MNRNQPADFRQDRELIGELLTSLDIDSQLFRFAQLVQAGIDACEHGNSAVEEIENLSRQIGALRHCIESDQEVTPTTLSESESRWGHLLGADDDTMCVDKGWQNHDDQFDDEETESLDVPSPEQIQSLMHNLHTASPQLAAPEQTSDSTGNPASSTESSSRENSTATPQLDGAESKTKRIHELKLPELEAAVQRLDTELREALVEDTVECVASMEAALLKLENVPHDKSSIQQILRELHTLKGASASVGLSLLAEQIHAIEDQLREDQTSNRKPDVDQLLRSVDVLSRVMAGKRKTNELPSQPARSMDASDQPTLPEFTEGPTDDETVRVKASKLNRLMDMLAELVMLRNRRDTELEELQEVYHELIGSVSKMRLLSNEERASSQQNSSIQLSEIANDVMTVAQNVRDCARPVAEGNAAVSKFIRQFRQELAGLRRTPIAGLFQRLQRSVRDAANAESKKVELRLVGEQAGIERSLQQRLYEPLLHIVRNSVCHGIESLEKRRQVGKPEIGVITIEAKSGPDMLVIEIQDDGQGLDYDAIRRRGIERGLLSPNHAACDDELAQLIFQPGFSTRQSANQVAGRGVGMDIVAATLQRMRGWLEVDSIPGHGTTIRLSLPLPSLVQHAMVFRTGKQLFALPMQSVLNAGKLGPSALQLSMRDLANVPAIDCDDSPDQQTGIVLAYQTSAGDSTKRVTLIVDEIVGPEEVVVRPLPNLLKRHPFCSGATLSGLAQTVLLVDARRMIDTNQHLLRGGIQPEKPSEPECENQRVTVLVADDSLSARRRVIRSLSRYDVDIVEASDGQQALQKFQTHNFAAIFSDMEMPHLGGLDLLAAVNQQMETQPPPVVIISSRNEPEFTEPARALGAADYLLKPLTDDALDQTLQRLGIFDCPPSPNQRFLQPGGVTR